MSDKKRYLVTSALPYANGPLHIGHLAGAYIGADIYVRYLRLMGKDVVWVCGSDEHGAAITIRAMKEGLTPREIIDKYDAMFRKSFSGMGISFDIFHRTSEPLHYETSQDFFRTLHKNGEFEEIETEQYYDDEKKTFLADRYIMGVCPICSNPDAYGDQCEKCGSTLSPNDLKQPVRSILSGSTLTKKPTKHWFLKLNEYEKWLKRWITEGVLEHEDGSTEKTHDPNDWKNHVLGQCKSWLEGGLQPRAMTRDLDWGIPVPPEIDTTGTKKLYVWMDAPIGYISATKQWAIDQGEPDLWKKYWQNKDTALIHFIGKDNIVFHCLIFPALLKEHGGFVLPVNVPANQFMNLEGRKISTSRNWAVWVHEYLEYFEGKEDDLRYNMIKNMPELQDSEFTWKRFQETTNNELVANFANFIHRVLTLTHKFYEGSVPDVSGTEEVELKIKGFLKEYCAHIEKFDFRSAMQIVMDISTFGNQYLQNNEPWKKVKTNPEETALVMYDALEIVEILSIVCRPFLPFASDKIRKMLNLSVITEGSPVLKILFEKLEDERDLFEDGHVIGTPEHLFTRFTDEVIDAQIKKLELTDLENNPPAPVVEAVAAPVVETPQTIDYQPLNATIGYDDFAKMDIRTGTILTAETVKGSDKLLKLSVDMGFETRTIMSGIAKHFKAEEIVGQQIVVLANLAPRKMMGVESNGMVLLAEDLSGKLSFVNAPQGVGNGFIIK
jgi:methionyl-tRNA synthetase